MAKKLPSHAWVFIEMILQAIVTAFKSARKEKNTPSV